MKGHNQIVHILLILIGIGGLLASGMNYNKKTKQEKDKEKTTYIIVVLLFLAVILIASFEIYKNSLTK